MVKDIWQDIFDEIGVEEYLLMLENSKEVMKDPEQVKIIKLGRAFNLYGIKMKMNIKRLKKVNWMEIVLTMVFSLGLVFIIFGIYIFMGGFHNVDLVFNNQYILAKQNKTIDSFYDMYNSNGDTMSEGKLYIIGMEMMFKGLTLVGFGGLFLGLCIRNLTFRRLVQSN